MTLTRARYDEFAEWYERWSSDKPPLIDVTGVDISAAMLGRARAAGPANITYLHADVTGDLGWWDGRAFDGCTCEMALMDIDDQAGTLSAVTRPTASCPPT